MHPLETLCAISGDNLAPSVHVAGVEVLIYLSSTFDEIQRCDWERRSGEIVLYLQESAHLLTEGMRKTACESTTESASVVIFSRV